MFSVHSVSVIYYSFPLTDQSKLVNIYLAALIKSVDTKDFGNDSCYILGSIYQCHPNTGEPIIIFDGQHNVMGSYNMTNDLL